LGIITHILFIGKKTSINIEVSAMQKINNNNNNKNKKQKTKIKQENKCVFCRVTWLLDSNSTVI
jgi:cytochrome c-type biogenesis protein CcmH/NrfF